MPNATDRSQPISATVNDLPPLLRIARDGRSSFRWLTRGKPGSIQTAAEMAALVREAAVKDEGLEAFAAKIIQNAGLDSHSDQEDVIDALFRYVQQIAYKHDPEGSFDAIRSARETIRLGFGDCDDLSILLGTLLALCGFRPRFVLARYSAESEGYDHVYVDVETKAGRIALDPTSRNHGIGWESPRAIERIAYPVFSGTVNALGDIGMGDVNSGGGVSAQTKSNVIASAIAAIGHLFGGPSPQQKAERLIGSQFDQADKQVAAYLLTLNRKADNGTLTAADLNQAALAVDQLEQLAQQQSGIAYVAKQWEAEAPRYAAWLTDLASAGQRLGITIISGTSAGNASGATNTGTGSGGNVTSTATASLGGLSVPVLLLGAAALYLLIKS